MTALKQLPQGRSRPFRYAFERIMATLALVNLVLVAFDLSYIPWRDWYLKQFPAFTQWYGEQFKGIAPHRDIVTYLDTVDRLEAQVADNGVRSPESEELLTELQTLSAKLVDENPFELVGKSGTLERLKNEMRDRMNNESSKQSFATFWSQNHLTQAGWSQEIGFFNDEIRPLMQTNYFRNIDETGGFVDRFWFIDLWFVGIFAIEFAARTLSLSRRYRGVTWFDTMLWRWYDLLLLIPFWRWLRVIPVVVRLNQSKLVNLESIRVRINHSLVASFAVELTEIVVLRVIEQTQNLLREGTVSRWLLKPDNRRRYIDLNGVDEVQAITSRLLNVLVHRTLPKIRPDLEALIQHSLTSVLQQAPMYGSLQSIPGFNQLPNQLVTRLTTEITDALYHAINASLNDASGAELGRHLVENLATTFSTELQQEKTLEEIESLVMALLDELKINYVNQLAAADVETLREQTQQLYQISQGRQS